MADTWTPISGYTPQEYTDTAVFEVNSDTKKIALITGQALVAGEENAQYIKFLMSRYWDGIDIKDKDFYVEYALAGTYYGKTAVVNAEYNDEKVRFGWVVPKEACCISGTLLFVLRVESTDYILKTQIAEHPVFRSVNVEDVVPEPTKEVWYREFEARVEIAIDDAEAALAQAQQAVTSAETAAQNAQTAEDNAEAAAAMAQTRYGSPLTAQSADDMLEQNRVYVYVGSESGYTNGHWYYYDGTEWADGGVYNGSAVNTDTTLTQSGMAADAKAVGDELSTIKEDLSSGRLNYYDNSYLSGLADDFYKIDNTATWEQGSWTSSGDVDANTWIRTPSANKLSGGFLIHNKDTRYGFFVAKYNATTGVWAGYYGSSDALNTNEYTYIPVQSNVVYKLRIRYVANNSTPLSPSENMIDIYRGLGVEARFRNSPSFVGLTGSDYDNTFANIAGVANVITNLAYSQWSDIPFGGAAISTQYTTNYDLQIIFGIGTNAIAYRFVSRSTKVPYNSWQITTDTQLSGKKIAIIGDSRSSYQGTVPSGNAYYYPKSSGAVLTSLSEMWWKKLADFFGMELTVNDSYSGGYVANKDGGNGANILSSDTAINNLGATVPDIIIIFAGVNDWNANAVQIGNYDGTGAFPSDNSTFREAFAILLSKVQKKFPNADIWVCTNPYCCPAGTGSTISEMPVPKAGNGGVALKVFNDAIRELAEVFGCGVIDFTKCGTNWGNLVTYTGDYDTDNGLHYNASGHQLLFETARNTLYQYYKANG